MAQVPAETAGGRGEGSSALPQSDLMDGLGNLNLWRQLGLMLGLAASVAIGVAVVMWAQGDDYRPLYGSLDRLDSAEVLQVLDTAQIPYKVDTNTGALLVAADRVHQARLKLAEVGIPGEQSQGFELLDKEQPLGTSQFMENARYRRSLEGELARTIASIHSVRSARVHLAIPKQSVFLRDRREPTASVLVELFPGRRIEPDQVRAITNLVATSIPELTAENVTVVDQRGNLLSRMVLDDPKLVAANRQLEYTQRVEERLSRRIHSILEPMLGGGKFRAEVAADIDFTAVEQAQELYNPDLPAVRSESRSEETRRAGESIAGIPGALSNQPPASGEAPEQAVANAAGQPAAEAEPQRSRSQVVRNYELDRTVSYTKHEVGRVSRLTVAVAVDDKMVADPVSGETTRQPWSAEELERFAILVRDAVGFDAARGDSVNVINSSFVSTGGDSLTVESQPWYQADWFLNLVKLVLAALAVLAIVFGVLRPVMKSLSQSAREGRDFGSTGALPDGSGGAMGMAEGLGDETVTLTGGDNMLLPGPQSYEQQINAIKGLIADDPGRVAQVVKKWIASGE